jgi:oxygen-independent coproporphyrinogen III oxidase
MLAANGLSPLTFPAAELNRRFGAAATPLLEEAQALIEADGAAFRVTERGRPFVRAIAACFDSYLGTKATRHSAGV